jgi:hypothetical protein
VKDNAEHVAAAGMEAAHAVPMFDSNNAAGTFHRTIPHCEYRQIALPQPKNLDSRLHARALFRHDEVAAFEIAARFRQYDRCLQRKDLFPVHARS